METWKTEQEQPGDWREFDCLKDALYLLNYNDGTRWNELLSGRVIASALTDIAQSLRVLSGREDTLHFKHDET